MSIVVSRRSGVAVGGTPGTAIRSMAAVMLAVEIAVHAKLAPDHLREIPYIGAGFVIAAVLLTGVLVAIVVRPDQQLPWLIGALLCVGMAGLFVVSRVTGLPGFHESWTSDSGLGLVALPPELIFVLCAWAALATGRRSPV